MYVYLTAACHAHWYTLVGTLLTLVGTLITLVGTLITLVGIIFKLVTRWHMLSYNIISLRAQSHIRIHTARVAKSVKYIDQNQPTKQSRTKHGHHTTLNSHERLAQKRKHFEKVHRAHLYSTRTRLQQTPINSQVRQTRTIYPIAVIGQQHATTKKSCTPMLLSLRDGCEETHK